MAMGDRSSKTGAASGSGSVRQCGVGQGAVRCGQSRYAFGMRQHTNASLAQARCVKSGRVRSIRAHGMFCVGRSRRVKYGHGVPRCATVWTQKGMSRTASSGRVGAGFGSVGFGSLRLGTASHG